MDCLLCGTAHVPPFARLGDRDYFRCPHCQLTFLHPLQMPDLATEKAQYDLHENNPDDPGYRAFLRRVANPLVERLAPGSFGLDFGCGPGPALAAMLGERGFVMEIYDPIYFQDESVLENRYDFITCTEVVEHFHHPTQDLARMLSLLKPGGWLAIMTSWLTDDIDFARWHYPRDPTHVCFFRPETFTWLAQQHYCTLVLEDDNVVLLQKMPDRKIIA